MKIKNAIDHYLYTINEMGQYVSIAKESILSKDETRKIGSWDGFSVQKLIDEIITMEIHRGNYIETANCKKVTVGKIHHPIPFKAIQQVSLDHSVTSKDIEFDKIKAIISTTNHWIDKQGWCLIEVKTSTITSAAINSAYVDHIYVVCPTSQLVKFFLEVSKFRTRMKTTKKPSEKEVLSLIHGCNAFEVDFKKKSYRTKLG